MPNCLVCDEVIQENFTSLFNGAKSVCYECFNKFKIRNSKFIVDGVRGVILYYYDEFFKDLLYKYKGCYDYALKDVFLVYKTSFIKRKYKGYSIVLAPSNNSTEKQRGFNHLEEIFKCLNMPIIKCFKKTKQWKQSDKSLCERKQIQNIIKIDKTCLNGVKKVLVVDDVLTSGSTIKAMISQLPPDIDKKVLVLSSNCRISSNEIV